MKSVDLYGRVRRAVLIDGMSRREAARIFGIDRRTVDKILKFSLPPGYRRTVILPFLTGCDCRIYAAILSFCIGVIPPMPILGRSLLYVHSHRVA